MPPHKYKYAHNSFATSILVFLSLLYCISACSQNPAEISALLTKEADTLYQERHYTAAITKLEQIMKLPLPLPPREAYTMLAKAYLLRSNLPRANAVLRKAVEHYPDNPEILLAVGNLEIISFQLEEATQTLQKLSNAKAPEIDILRGDLATLQDSLPEAEKAYRQAVKQAPQSATALIRLATCLAGMKRPAEAEQTYQHLLTFSPLEPNIIHQMGNFWLLRGDQQQAVILFKKAISMDKENLTLKKRLAEFHYNNQQYEQAATLINEALQQAPTNRFFKKFLIDVLLRQNKLNLADMKLTELTDSGSPDIETLLLRGKHYILLDKPNFAISQFSEAIEKEPNFPLSHYLLAVAYMLNNRPSLAQQSAIQALSLDPYFSVAEILLADIFYKKNEYDTSLQYIERVKKKEPENFRPYLISGNILLGKNKNIRARKDFMQSAKLNPTLVSPIFFSAVALEQEGRSQSAAKSYLTIFKENPSLLLAASRYINIILEDGDIAKVRDFFNSHQDSTGMSPLFHLIAANGFLKSDAKEEAEQHYKAAISLAPNSVPTAYLRLADIYSSQQNTQQFTATLTTCTQAIPDYFPAFLKLADFYARTARVDKAIDTLHQGLSRNPGSPELANSLAWLYLDQNTEIDKAFLLAQKSYERRPKDPAVADTLGWAYFKKNLLTRAQWTLEEAIRLSPDQPLINFHLATVLVAKDHKKEAVPLLKKCLSLELQQPYRTEAKDLLDKLQPKVL